tara:strand:- start:320 stop:598 length:279 start_codon:yes stop_codon:yes gene_type:complete
MTYAYNYDRHPDHLHGDEAYNQPAVEVNLEDVINAIAMGESTEDGMSHHDWIKRACAGDAITNIMQHICCNIDDPKYRFITDQLKQELEGWL